MGPVDADELTKLEVLLGQTLPEAFKRFVREYGGGGIVGAEISGIEGNDAEIIAGGTVFGDTLECRKDFGLPEHLAVIYFHGGEICWCLDTSSISEGDCPVVSYGLRLGRIDGSVSPSFRQFLKSHFSLRADDVSRENGDYEAIAKLLGET